MSNRFLTPLIIGHDVSVFDQHRYDLTGYVPSDGEPELAASVDHNKIVRLPHRMCLSVLVLINPSSELRTERKSSTNSSHWKVVSSGCS